MGLAEKYPLPRTRTRCDQLGLMFDDTFADTALVIADIKGVAPDALDALGERYAERAWQLANPRSYTLRQRLMLAWHFLFGRAPGPR